MNEASLLLEMMLHEPIDCVHGNTGLQQLVTQKRITDLACLSHPVLLHLVRRVQSGPKSQIYFERYTLERMPINTTNLALVAVLVPAVFFAQCQCYEHALATVFGT
jgi:hypothetical protein